jgi:hypothetical protein
MPDFPPHVLASQSATARRSKEEVAPKSVIQGNGQAAPQDRLGSISEKAVPGDSTPTHLLSLCPDVEEAGLGTTYVPASRCVSGMSSALPHENGGICISLGHQVAIPDPRTAHEHHVCEEGQPSLRFRASLPAAKHVPENSEVASHRSCLADRLRRDAAEEMLRNQLPVAGKRPGEDGSGIACAGKQTHVHAEPLTSGVMVEVGRENINAEQHAMMKGGHIPVQMNESRSAHARPTGSATSHSGCSYSSLTRGLMNDACLHSPDAQDPRSIGQESYIGMPSEVHGTESSSGQHSPRHLHASSTSKCKQSRASGCEDIAEGSYVESHSQEMQTMREESMRRVLVDASKHSSPEFVGDLTAAGSMCASNVGSMPTRSGSASSLGILKPGKQSA